VWEGRRGSVGGLDPEISLEQTEVRAPAETISELPEREKLVVTPLLRGADAPRD
jgi:hypothetical protein